MHEFLTADQTGQPGYEGYLNHSVVPITSLMRDAGYRTYMAGEWHLGGDEGARLIVAVEDQEIESAIRVLSS